MAISGTRADRIALVPTLPTYRHHCLGCGAQYITHLVMSPAASAHMCPPGIHLASPAYYDEWSEGC